MEFSNNNPNNLTLAEIREEAYKQGRTDYENECAKRYCCYSGKDCIIGNLVEKEAYKQGRVDALNKLLDGLSHFNDANNGSEHFLFGIETCREMIKEMKGELDV